MICYDFIVKILKLDFRYISRKRDGVDFALHSLKIFLHEFSSVGEGLVSFALPSQKLWAKLSEKNDDFFLQTSLEFLCAMS